jgi:hypothetical protein
MAMRTIAPPIRASIRMMLKIKPATWKTGPIMNVSTDWRTTYAIKKNDALLEKPGEIAKNTFISEDV